MLEIDSLFKNRYKILRYIGRGGMADVFKAEDTISKYEVAIKLVRQDSTIDLEKMYKLFSYEIKVVSKIENHFNIVRIFDYGKYNDSIPFMVTEFINGQTLKQTLNNQKTFGFIEACGIIIQLLDALSELKVHSIIHRDIKPQNIYLQPDGIVKLADFGIATIVTETKKKKNDNLIAGTPQYLAPEIALGSEPSYLSDLYSLGITFFEIISGIVPFDDKDPNVVLKKAINDTLPDITSYRNAVPSELSDIIGKACAKNPKDRYQTPEEMKTDVQRLMKNPKKLRSQNFLERFFGLKGK